MPFSLGYQLPDEDDSTPDIVKDYREHVAEVYFAPPGEPSARAPLGSAEGWDVGEAYDAMISDLACIAGMGTKLVLLLNASCYGHAAASATLERRVAKTVEALSKSIPLSIVTTASPVIARVLKKHSPHIEVRASVNMRVGTIRGMEYLSDHFDGYYMSRECNRDPATIEQLSAWCRLRGKSLHLLANSGCLRDCAFQTFHDNLVSHEAEIAAADQQCLSKLAPCWEFLDSSARWVALLQNTWIRPEDLHHYEAYFDGIKLATRMHPNPRKVLGAYASKRYHGNLLDLLEPNHSLLLRGRIVANDLFPDDWHAKTTSCRQACHACSYCSTVLKQVLVDIATSREVQTTSGLTSPPG